MIWGGGIGLNRMSMFLYFRFRQRAGNRPTRQLLSSPPAAAACNSGSAHLIRAYIIHKSAQILRFIAAFVTD